MKTGKPLNYSHNSQNLNALCDEYITILNESGYYNSPPNNIDCNDIHEKLVATCEWTPASATELLSLAKTKGSFFLRNAAALAIALGVEDEQE